MVPQNPNRVLGRITIYPLEAVKVSPFSADIPLGTGPQGVTPK